MLCVNRGFASMPNRDGIAISVGSFTLSNLVSFRATQHIACGTERKLYLLPRPPGFSQPQRRRTYHTREGLREEEYSTASQHGQAYNKTNTPKMLGLKE